jgi:aryl-alcohol dehydrogenase-like predicted oxidoreductase
MDYVTLAPGLAPSSRLGFGCGSVMGRIGRDPSRRAIAAALDAGITHFDVARLYGYGEAEALLGEALHGRRDTVVIASKFGLAAPRKAAALRGLKPLAQKLAATIPGARTAMRSLMGPAATAADRFSVTSAQASLDQSLAALGTDYLDILFLHDCAAVDLTDELAGFLDRQIAGGKIRTYGVATGIDAVAPLFAARGSAILYQFANSLAVRNADRLAGAARQFVAHSPFFGADRLKARLGRADLHHLMLAWALAQRSIGVVLCSMLDPAHLRANLEAIERPRFGADELAAIAASAPAE